MKLKTVRDGDGYAVVLVTRAHPMAAIYTRRRFHNRAAAGVYRSWMTVAPECALVYALRMGWI